MTRNPVTRSALLLSALLLPLSPLRAEEPALRDLLRDALYTEEVSRDPDKAAEQYEKLLALHEEQRPFAATALFRLAEVRRKQDRKEEAIQLYQRLIREFPAATVEVKLAAGNLSALGAKVPAAGDAMSDEETKELQRLQALATTGPDVLKDPITLESAAGKGWLKVTEMLLEAGNDPYRSSALVKACQGGFLQICRLILDKRGLPPAETADDLLDEAVGSERMEILKLLLEKGFDVNRANALGRSVAAYPDQWNRPITELLIVHGANLDTMPAVTRLPAPTTASCGTPLHNALAAGNMEAANLLLDRGCKPDLPTPDHGITPLHIVASINADSADVMMKRLLQAGANPNRVTSKEAPLPQDRTWSNATPLTLAQSQTKRETMRILLAAGADPKEPKLLSRILDKGDEEMLRLVLDAGADPNSILIDPESNGSSKAESFMENLLKYTYNQPGKKEALFELMLSHGGKPSDSWTSNGFFNAPDEVKKLLNRRFIYADWAKLPQVTGVLLGRSSPVKLAEKTGQAMPGDLASLYSAALEQFVNPQSNEVAPLSANLIRFKEDGTFSETSVDFTKDDALPSLAWGDVVEFFVTDDNRTTNSARAWNLRKHRSARVTLEIAGQKRELTLRGNRLVFDVSSNEVPWSTAAQLIDLFWQTGIPKEELSGMGIVISVTRKDWPELRLDFPSNEATRFELQEGDSLKLVLPPDIEGKIAEELKNGVTVTAPGLPFVRFFRSIEKGDEAKKPLAPLTPSLVQLMAELYGGQTAIPSRFIRNTGGDFSLLSYLIDPKSRWGMAVVPYPDLGDIRVLRHQQDGTLATIKVDWTALIDAAGGEVTAEDVKKSDVALQPGDVVELRIRKDHPEQEWKGFGSKEEIFIAKALQGRVQIIDRSGEVSLQQISYKAADYLETPAGWLPVAPKAGTASATADDVFGSSFNQYVTIIRDGIEFQPLHPATVFLRDGDVIRTDQNQGQQPGRPPRPRVVPAPQQSPGR